MKTKTRFQIPYFSSTSSYSETVSNIQWTISVRFSFLRFPFVTELVDKKKYGRNVPKELIIKEVTLEIK